MNSDNIANLEANGYKYIIGTKIKNESRKIREWILEQSKVDYRMVEYDKGNGLQKKTSTSVVNKFLKMEGNAKVIINYEKIEVDAR